MEIPAYQVADLRQMLIGTISTQCSEKSAQVIIITGDRDLMQLVNDKVKLCMPVKGLSDTQIIDRDKVYERLGGVAGAGGGL